MPLTFGEVKADVGVRKIIPDCPSSDEFADYVNSATRMLMRRGDWWETAVPIFVCVTNGCIVWPRYVGQVRKLNICNQPVMLRNLWYEFMVGVQSGCGAWRNWMGMECGMKQQGQSPVMQDILGEGRTVRAYARCNADYGKTITIFGTDNNGQPLKHLDLSTNTWQAGQVLTLNNTFASTTTFVRHIDYVTKDVTQCIVDVYGYDAVNDVLEDIAHYEGGETTPSYSKTKLDMAWPWTATGCSGSSTPSCCGTRRGVLALVKLKFIPVVADSDLVLIPNIDALKSMFRSIRLREKGDLAGAVQYEMDAVRELNRELEDHSPDEQFSTIDNTFGGVTFSNQAF